MTSRSRFYEETGGQVSWSQYADFGQQDVHRQFAIVFKTPAYKDPHISEPRQVYLQLTRPSDGETSDSKPFQYTPDDPGMFLRFAHWGGGLTLKV